MNPNDTLGRTSLLRVSLLSAPLCLFAVSAALAPVAAAGPSHVAGVSWLGKAVFLTSTTDGKGTADGHVYDPVTTSWMTTVPGFTRPTFDLDPGQPVAGAVFKGSLCFFSVRKGGLELHTMDMNGKWSDAMAVPMPLDRGTANVDHFTYLRAQPFLDKLYLTVFWVDKSPAVMPSLIYVVSQIGPTVKTSPFFGGIGEKADLVVFQKRIPGALPDTPQFQWVMAVPMWTEDDRGWWYSLYFTPDFAQPRLAGLPGVRSTANATLWYGPGENYSVDQVQLIFGDGTRTFYDIDKDAWTPGTAQDRLAIGGLSSEVAAASASGANKDGTVTQYLVVAGWQGTNLVVDSRPSQTFTPLGRVAVVDTQKEVANQPSAWNVIGIIQGPGVYSLNGWQYEDYGNGDPATVEMGTSKSTNVSTTSETGNGVDIKIGYEGEVGFIAHAKIDTGVDTTLSFKSATESSSKDTFEQRTTYSAKDSATPKRGWMVVSMPVFDVYKFQGATKNGTKLPQQIFSSVVRANTKTFIPFDITNPGADPVHAAELVGMAPAPASTDIEGWHGRDSMYASDYILEVGGEDGILSNIAAGSGVSSCSTYEHEHETAISSSSSVNFDIHTFIAGNGMGYDHDSSTDSSTTTTFSTTLEACLSMKNPKADPTVYPRLMELNVKPHFLVPTSDASGVYKPPFWISTAARQYGWTPWLLTWDVISWEGDLAPTSPGSGGTAAVASGLVHVAPTPSGGGTLFVDAAETRPNVYPVPVGEGFWVEAAPAPGYRFAYWESPALVGVRDRRAATTLAALLKKGGGTLRAHFEKKAPTAFEVSHSWSSGTSSLRVGGAFLDPALASFDPKAETLAIVLGKSEIVAQGGTWSSTPWTRRFRATDGTIDLVLDFSAHTWSAVVAGVDLSHLLREKKPGELSLGLRRDGTPYLQAWPVRAMGEWDLAGSDGARQAIDFRSARARVEMDTALPGGAIHLVIEDAVLPCQGFDPGRESHFSIGGLKLKLGRWYGGWGGLYVQYGENAQAVYAATLDPASGQLGLEAYLKTERNVIFDGGHHQTVHVSTDAGGSTESGQVHFDLASMKVYIEQAASSASAASREQPQDATVNWAAAARRHHVPVPEGDGTPVRVVKR